MQYYVYIMAKTHRSVVYTGVTNNLERRLFEHKNGTVKGFTEKYNVYKLVWFDCTSDVYSAIEKDKQFYKNSGGGVTFSGGECMLQIDFLEEILKECKKNGIHTAVDTAGHVPFEFFERIIPYTDLFLYDVKCFDSDKHRQYTGVENQLILKNLKSLLAKSTPVWIRIPIIPTVNDTEEELQRIKEYLYGHVPFDVATACRIMAERYPIKSNLDTYGLLYDFFVIGYPLSLLTNKYARSTYSLDMAIKKVCGNTVVSYKHRWLFRPIKRKSKTEKTQIIQQQINDIIESQSRTE